MHHPARPPRRVGEQLFEERRLDRAGAEGVGSNALARVLHRDLARHREHAAFARCVRDLCCRRTHERDERRNVDDAAAAGLEHRRYACLAAEPHAFEVHVHDGVPRALGRVEHATVIGRKDARVVVEDVKTAVLVDGGANHLRTVGRLRDVGTHVRRFAARRMHGRDRRLAGILGEIRHHDARALSSEQLCGRAAHTAACARDERDLARQSIAHFSPPRVCTSACRRRPLLGDRP